ncbi:TetR family transcriptional regulator C-terminal domain-containing protein [Actinophytocola sp. KF-1]
MCYKGNVPKIVDPDERRRLVTEAIFTIVVRDGLAHASLRNIAEEAGLAVGSVRHYFTDSEELIQFALRALVDRIGARILARAEQAIAESDREKRRALTTELLGELLPLDETRYTESAVWLAFATEARTTPSLRPHVRDLYDGTRRLVGKVLARSRELGGLADEVDIEVETERLTALLDGLMTNGVIQPDRMTPDLMRTVLDAHLDSIAKI